MMKLTRNFLKELIAEEINRLHENSNFFVYRVGDKAETDLNNKNAANLEDLISFIEDECEDYAMLFCLGKDALITQYKITAAEMGDFQPFRGGEPRGDAVNLETVGATEPKGSWNSKWYSFPKGANWAAAKQKSIPITQLKGLTMKSFSDQLETLKNVFN